MSQCPYGVRAEQAIAPILKEFGDKIDFALYFIASEDGIVGSQVHTDLRKYPRTCAKW